MVSSAGPRGGAPATGPDRPDPPVRASGVVRSWNYDTGVGVVSATHGDRELVCHVRDIRSTAAGTIRVGDSVTFEILFTVDGARAIDVRRERERGRVLRWVSSRGFGFLGRRGGADLFCHISQCPGEDTLRVGAVVTFAVSTDAKGRPHALSVRVEEDAALRQS